MPITTLEARLVARDVERGLCGFVWGAAVQRRRRIQRRDVPGVLTLHWMIAEGLQRNSSMQFVGSHNLTSSPKAGA